MPRPRILKIAERVPPIEINEENLNIIVAGLEKQLANEKGTVTAALLDEKYLLGKDIIVQAMIGMSPDFPIRLNIYPGRVKDMIDNLKKTKKIV